MKKIIKDMELTVKAANLEFNNGNSKDTEILIETYHNLLEILNTSRQPDSKKEKQELVKLLQSQNKLIQELFEKIEMEIEKGLQRSAYVEVRNLSIIANKIQQAKIPIQANIDFLTNNALTNISGLL